MRLGAQGLGFRAWGFAACVLCLELRAGEVGGRPTTRETGIDVLLLGVKGLPAA